MPHNDQGATGAQIDPFTADELNDIEAIALAAPKCWYGTCQISDGITDERAVDLIETCSPDTIVTLIGMARTALARASQQARDDEFTAVHRDLKGEPIVMWNRAVTGEEYAALSVNPWGTRASQQATYQPEGAVCHAGEAAGRTETEMGERLRRVVLNNPGTMVSVRGTVLRTASDECDRFYNGMMAWKRTAQEKDQIIIDLRVQLASAQKDAARYRVLREHVAPRDVSISMMVPPQDIPPEQSIEERIDMLCDGFIARAQITNTTATGE